MRMPLDRTDHFLLGLTFILLLFLAPLLWQQSLNHDVFLYINHLGLYVHPIIWSHITLLGDGVFALSLVSVFVLIDSYKPSINRQNFSPSIVIGAILLGLFIQITKRVLEFARPVNFFPSNEINIIGEALSHHSFPSGHSATIFFLATAVIVYFNIRSFSLLSIILSIAILGALSRITVGVHFPNDVLVGSLCGILAGWVVMRVWIAKKYPTPIVIASLITLMFASIALLLHDPKLPGVDIFIIISGIVFFICSVINLWRLRQLIINEKLS